MENWSPEGHLARFIVEIATQLDLTIIKSAYSGRDSKAHHPEMLLALLFYGYATGVLFRIYVELFKNVPPLFRGLEKDHPP